MVFAAAIFGMLALAAAAEAGPAIVTYDVVNYGTRQDDFVVTFGSIFAPGDVPRGTGLEAIGAGGSVVPLQLDRKATNPDGSLRHGIVTLRIPHLAANRTMPVTLRRVVRQRGGSGKTIPVSDLPAGFDVQIVLKQKDQSLEASARAMLAHRKVETWLHGPLVSEWWVSGPFRSASGQADPHLSARFGVRCYGKGMPLRIDVIVENDWTFVSHPQTEFYDAEIRMGSKTVFSKVGMVQPSQTRWRRGFWWDQPVSIYVKQNLDYMKRARIVPNYDPDLRISESAIANAYKKFENSDRAPMDAGIITRYMPTTGGRADIAPLPQWQAIYLLSMDPRAYEITLQSADLGAGFPSHFRNEKTGSPTTPEDYPSISTDSDVFGQAGQPQRPDTGRYHNPLIADPAHEPALDFIPYVVTGDRFYLEELQFWAMWNAMYSGAQYRGYSAGLLHTEQIRGQAWSLRTLAQAEYITPDSDPLKAVLRRQLEANIAWYNSRYTNNRSANRLGAIERDDGYDSGRSIAPWQDDFFTWSVGYVQGLGDVNAGPLLRWKAQFPVGRMVAPGFCWILATSYTLHVRDGASGPYYPTFAQIYRATLPGEIENAAVATKFDCASSEMADALGLKDAGEMVLSSGPDGGYAAYLQPALAAAVDSGIAGARSAWDIFMSRSGKPDYSAQPGWDIVPR